MQDAYLLNGLSNKYDVNTRAAYVCCAQCRVHEYLAAVGPRPDRLRSTLEGRVRCLGIRHLRRLGTPAEHMRRTHQYVHTMCANHANYDCTDPAEQQPAVFYRVWHGQDARPQGRFQEMRQGTQIPEIRQKYRT